MASFLLKIVNILVLSSFAVGHSWVEQVMRSHPNVTAYGGGLGYIRNYVPRSDPLFHDQNDTYMLPMDGRSQLSQTDFICKDTQRQPDYGNALQLAAGASILFKYNENGHITKPWSDPTKPGSGTVYIYGTDEPKADEKILDVHKVWPEDFFKGVGHGSLLGTFNFDDSRCYQYSDDSEIEKERQIAFGHGSEATEGLNLWCTNLVTLPMIMFKPTYTIYWVCDWPDKDGSPQLYTSCLDLLIG